MDTRRDLLSKLFGFTERKSTAGGAASANTELYYILQRLSEKRGVPFCTCVTDEDELAHLFLLLRPKSTSKRNTSYSIKVLFFTTTETKQPTAGTLGLVHKVLLIILWQ